MARSVILTIEPIALGGVPTMMKAVDGLLRRWGHIPTLVYADAESVPDDGLRSLIGYYFRRPLPRREVRDGLNGLAIPLWPLPQWLSHYAPAIAVRRELAAAQVRVVVAGSAHVGLPFALSDRPFVTWVATVYEEEIQARASVGDRWAQRLLAGRTWPRLQAQEARVLERSAVVLALSPHTAEVIQRRFNTLASRVRTVLCPIDTEVFRPAESGSSNNAAVTRAVRGPFLLFTARIRDPRKNVTMLLKAFARIRAARPELSLVIIGDAPLESHLGLCRALGLADSVIFLPPMARAELVPYYRAAELFVLSSMQEGLGISFIEALACGTPVVATRCGGPEGVIRDGETGWLVPNNDAAAFAEAVLLALADRGQLAAMRENSRRFAERELAKPVVEAKLLTALREVFPEEFASPPAPAPPPSASGRLTAPEPVVQETGEGWPKAGEGGEA